MSRYDCDVVVIGAGLAGLNAALSLADAGLDVRVVEAKSRTGGRIHSMRQLGKNAEAGGTYIGAGYARTMALAERFAIPLIDVTPVLQFFREQELALGTEIIRQSEWPEHPANPFPDGDRELMPWNYHRVLTMRDNPLDGPEDWLDPRHAALDVSMRDWMLGMGLSEEVVKYGYGINTTFGADATDVSALLLLFRGAFSKAQRKLAPEGSLGFTVENGVDRIPTAMAEALAREVELDKTVVGIATDADEARVGFADGSEIRARRIVCSAPFGALGRVAFTPELPPLQAEAVESLGAQPITQAYIACERPFWQEDGYAPSMFTDSVAGMVAGVRSASDPETVTHLTSWVIGPHAKRLDGLDEADAGHEVIDAIERIRPAARGALELIALKSWSGDALAGGAWAYFRPGQIGRFARVMGEAHGRVHFCGEHLGLESRGMEAALETGERAAREVVAAEN